MADLGSLPNFDQTVAAFRAEFSDLLQGHIDASPGNPDSDAIRKVLGSWGDFVDGSVAVLQSDYSDRRILGFIVIGGRVIVQVTVPPEGVATAAPGSLALETNGSIWVKRGGVGNTGWRLLAGMPNRVLHPNDATLEGAASLITLNQHRAIRMPDGSTTGGHWDLWIPEWFGGGFMVADIRMFSATGNAGANTVRLGVSMESHLAGHNMNADSFDTETLMTITPATLANRTAVMTSTVELDGAIANGPVRFRLRRIGADGADTFTGALDVSHVRLLET